MNLDAKICILRKVFFYLKQSVPPTIILRHRKENLKKCSLRGLEEREDLIFLRYPRETLPNLENYVILTMDAPELSCDDQDKGLFLVDGTWNYAEKMLKNIPLLEKRSLPSQYKTAYPRKQTGCPDPETGLASVEALYISYQILHRDPAGLLDHYYWKEEFLQKNKLL